jgi:competence protein ComEA
VNILKRDFLIGAMALIIVIFCGVAYYNFSVLDEHQPQGVVASEPSDFQIVQTEYMLKVYITGEVLLPGVYEVTENSRVLDVLTLAGGASENADLSIINLARFISDGEHIIIPAFGDEPPEISNQTTLININTATKSELMTLPYIGEVTAESIITYRERNGRFTDKEQIKNVPRIGNRVYEAVEELITVR